MSAVPPSSLVKFASRNRRLSAHNAGELFFNRASVDGAPFRSYTGPPAFTERDFETKAVRVLDVHNGTFDTWNPEQNAQYLSVLDKVTNGWGQLMYIHREHLAEGTRIYIEWTQAYLEDGTISQTLTTQG